MEIGSLWNGWKVDKFLGEGSFGKVYRIVREEFGHTYESALKVIEIPQNSSEVESIRNEGLSDESVIDYFQSLVEDIVDEFALMSKLKGYTNIVSYEDHSVVPLEDGFGWRIYIRMELLTSLYEYMRNNILSIRDIIQLGIDICQGLEVCQKYNIIHRDIKPENIFVSDLGNFKLGDFGIARQLEKTSSGLSKKGTYTYMAPEVYKGMVYNSTVDIYSLGIVLYRFLNNNRSPFMPPYPETIKYSDKEKANVLRFSGESLPPPCNAEGRLAEIVLKACAYNPSERYESAVEMKNALSAVLYSEQEGKLIYPNGDELDNRDFSSSITKNDDNESENARLKDPTVLLVDADESVIASPIETEIINKTEDNEATACESVTEDSAVDNVYIEEVVSSDDELAPLINEEEAQNTDNKEYKENTEQKPTGKSRGRVIWIAVIAALCAAILLIVLIIVFSCNHDWMQATCDLPKTCSLCGKEEGQPLGHDWKDATCVTPITCSMCGEERGAALGHKWKDATCVSPETCSLCKETIGEALGHKWQKATHTEPEQCSVCGANPIGKSVYNYSIDGDESAGDKVSIGDSNTIETVVDPEVVDCAELTLYYRAESGEGKPIDGAFRFYVKDLSGEWVYVTEFDVNSDIEEYQIIFGYDSLMSFSAYTILPPESYTGSFTHWASIETVTGIN